MIAIIAAVAKNNVIGHNNTIPWDIPEERHLFRDLTWGHPIIMGRKTFNSLPHHQPLPGRLNIVVTKSLPLPEGEMEGVGDTIFTSSLEEALKKAKTLAPLKERVVTADELPQPEGILEGSIRPGTGRIPELDLSAGGSAVTGPVTYNSRRKNKTIFIIGGAQIYQQSFELADTMYISHLKNSYSGDTYFPEFNQTDWQAVAQKEYAEFIFITYKKQRHANQSPSKPSSGS